MANLQHQITERQHVIDELEQRGQVLDRTVDGADVRQQMEEIRGQMRVLEEQQRSRLGSAEATGGGSSWRLSELPSYVAE